MSETKKDTRARDWLLTMPFNKMTEREIERELSSYNYVGQQEISDKGYHHWHVFIQGDDAIRWSTLVKKFPHGDIQKRKFSSQQLYDYVTKSKTQVPDSQISNGEMKLSNAGASKMGYEDYLELIKGGTRYDDLILSESVPGPFMAPLKEVAHLVEERKLSRSVRDVKVNYLYGPSGVGKSHMVYNEHGMENVYRVTNYKNPFDFYKGQDVLFLDEFYDSVEFGYLLNVMDKWPFQMKARNKDHWAGYTKVWIVSNWKLEEQFTEIKESNMTQYLPFLRRITNNYTMDEDGLHLDNTLLDKYFPDR